MRLAILTAVMVTATPAEGNRMRVQFTPQVRYGKAEIRPEAVRGADGALRWELEARQPPNLADQLAKFAPVAGGVAPLAVSLDVIIDFMVASGSLKAADRPATSALLDRSILEFIAQDTELGPMARGEK